MGKLVLEQIQDHSDMYRLCFMVDASYETSLQKATFSNVEDALLALTPTLILDFDDESEAFERCKIYQMYHVPAIISMAGFDTEKIEMLQAIRTAKLSSPILIIESSFSLNQALALNLALQMLKFFASDVLEIRLTTGCNEHYDLAFSPFKILLESGKKVQHVVVDDKADACIDVKFSNSHIALNYSVENDDLWRGLNLLMDYVAYSSSSGTASRQSGTIMTDMLQQLVQYSLLSAM